MSSRLVPSLGVLALVSLLACGGAVATDVEGPPSSSSSSSSSGGSSGTPTPTPTPTTTAPTPTPTPCDCPAEWIGAAQGCGNFEIYFSNLSNEKFVIIDADKSSLGLSNVGDSVTVSLGDDSSGATIRLDTYTSPATSPPYCNDVISSTPSTSSQGGTGFATFTLSGTKNDLYQIDVTLKNVTVLQADGTSLALPDRTFTGITVGWFAG